MEEGSGTLNVARLVVRIRLNNQKISMRTSQANQAHAPNPFHYRLLSISMDINSY